MRRTTSVAAAALGGLLCAACGPEAPDPGRTDATTRSLLNQTTVAGPSTVIEGSSDISSRATRAYIPELGHNLGAVEAPLKLIEFSDFGCGFCRRFHEETFPALKAGFVDTGMIEWKFMPFITGMFENSLAVTEAAECTLEQDAPAFEAFSDMLWSRQSEWKPSDEPEALVRSWAAALGVDLDEYDACLSGDRRIERVAGATVAAQQLGVRGTPTFWIVGFGPLQGALPLDVFQGILGEVLTEVASGPAN